MEILLRHDFEELGVVRLGVAIKSDFFAMRGV
jgi:hypothetical protein